MSELEAFKSGKAVEAIATFFEFPELDSITVGGLARIGSKAARREIASLLESSDDLGKRFNDPCRRAQVLKYCEDLPKRLPLSLLREILFRDKHGEGAIEAISHLAHRISPSAVDMVLAVLEESSGKGGIDLHEDVNPGETIADILHRGLVAHGYGGAKKKTSKSVGKESTKKKKKKRKKKPKQDAPKVVGEEPESGKAPRALSKESADAIFDSLAAHAANTDKRQLTRSVAVRVLGSQRRKETLEIVRAILEKEREHRVLLAAATAAAVDMGDPSAGPWFVPIVESLKSASRRKKFLLDDLLLLLEAIYPLRIGGAEDFVIKMSKSKNLSIRTAAISSLPAIGEKKAVPLIRKYLADNKNWRIQLSAIEACRRMRTAAAVDLLIERIGKQSGRLKVDLLMALYGLTGVSMPYSKDDWNSWWEVNRAGYKPPAEVSRESAERETAVHFEGQDESTYFGLKIVSSRLCFIGDISGSMAEPMTYKEDEVERIGVMREELLRLVKTFKQRTYFNVYFFSNEYRSAFKHLTKISKSSFASASKFVTEAAARGGTNIFDPLEEALQDPYVDTIYLLSDGAPTAGKLTDRRKILTAVRKLNRHRRIKIHAISVGADSKFMRKLAKQNSGFYRAIK